MDKAYLLQPFAVTLLRGQVGQALCDRDCAETGTCFEESRVLTIATEL